MRFVKIDRTFVSKSPNDVRSRRLVAAIVTIARQLDITNIAEGIETTERAEYLTGAGCHLLQGYCFAPPASAAEIFAAGARAMRRAWRPAVLRGVRRMGYRSRPSRVDPRPGREPKC